ncbi:MAG TPA: Clp1/GlmU family protein [Nitrospira sp.]|nr:Clp1/GlmU family protein [Nitrospira sp.]
MMVRETVLTSLPPFPHTWTEASEALTGDPGIAVVIGASDSGKTTWVSAATRQLVQAGKLPVAIVDADIGQSTIGPPTTVALAILQESLTSDFRVDRLPSHSLFFVGSVSPPGHLLQILAGTKRLVDAAIRSGVGTVLVDTTGLIDQGPGFQLKLRKIELLGPRHLMALQRGKELEPLLAVVAGRPGLRIHRLEVAPSARARTPAERARYRADRFAAYFAMAHTLVLEAEQLSILAPPGGRSWVKTASASPLLQPSLLCREDLTGLLVGLHDSANDTLGLGVFEELSQDCRYISIRTPLDEAAAIRILQLGSIYLDQRERE